MIKTTTLVQSLLLCLFLGVSLQNNFQSIYPSAPLMSDYLQMRLKNYQKMHSDIISRQTSPNRLNPAYKYLVWTAPPKIGLGNRILGITSAFLLAFLTNRVLLVKTPDISMDQLFEEPFRNSSWVLSPLISLNE